MNGRLEKEIMAENKMKEKLSTLPEIFSEYYIYMRASKKTYTTINTYINYIIHFVKFIYKSDIPDDFYKNVKVSDIENYLMEYFPYYFYVTLSDGIIGVVFERIKEYF